jgi:hypothetical protein
VGGSTASSTSASRTCDRVQLGVIQGDLPDELRAHLESCPECGFLRTLSRNLVGALVGSPAEAGPLGAPLHAALQAAVAGGELLLSRYLLKSRIGHGGQGEVFRALDTETDELVALKIVRARAGDDRSADEVRNAHRVTHPNVCRVFHTARYGELRLIVMELIDGPPLDERGRMSRRRRLDLFRGVAAGVAAAHDAGVLHLDLKPRNVLLRGGQVPVVTDFGLSVRVHDRGGSALSSGGTPAYMAPEQRDGRPVDRRTDVYALGLLLRDLVDDRPRLLGRVIRRAAAAEPARRYRDIGQLVRAVDLRRRLARWGLRLAVALALITLALIGLAMVLPPPHGPRVAWRTDLWGDDPVPADAWNVARNPGGVGRPRVVAAPGFGCGQNREELVDGVGQYSSWEHGFAFPAQIDVCIGLDFLAPRGLCGELRPEAELCEFWYDQASKRQYRILDHRVADAAAVAPSPGTSLGQVERAVPCGERTLVVELDRPRPVLAVRLWHVERRNLPNRFEVRVQDDSGRMRPVFSTNIVRFPRAPVDPPGLLSAIPITTQFSTVTTERIEVMMDTCSMAAEGQGWLFEVEVFARIPRREAWWRHFTE